MTVSKITEQLYVGSQPVVGRYLAGKGVQTLCLCAMEFQPEDSAFPGVETVLRCPIDDAEPTPAMIRMVKQASQGVANSLAMGKRTLVVCHMGLNRSALVAALALIRLGVKPSAAVEAIKQARGKHCFSNRWFEQVALKFRPGLR